METTPNRQPMTPFFVLWGGQAVSLLGSQAVQFALIWWLTAETGSATVLATASFLALAPHVIFGPFVGALIDRWDRKQIMLAADALVAAASLVLALLFIRDAVTPVHLYGLLFVRAVGGVFHATAMTASTSLMVPPVHLTRIQGLNQAVQGGQLIVSAPLGALLYAVLPMAGVMAVDVVTALIAIVPLIFIRVPQPVASTAADGRAGILASVADGLRYLHARAGHVPLLALGAVVNLFMVPAFSLLPLLVLAQGGDALRLGAMNAIFGIGTLAGGVALGIWGGLSRRVHTMCLGLGGAGLATLALGLAPTLGGASVAIAGVGLAIPLVNGPIIAILQTTIVPQMQGRVIALYGSICGMMTPLGLAAAAPVAEMFGVRVWYVLGGLACIAMGLLAFAIPSIARIESDAPTGGTLPVASRPDDLRYNDSS